MKLNLFQKIAGALCLLAVTASGAAAQTQNKYIDPADAPPSTSGSPLSFSLRTGLYSDYYYRGLALYPGVSIQPSLGVFYTLGSFGTVGASLWMHLPGEDKQDTTSFFDADGNLFVLDRKQKFFEMDTTLSYDVTVDLATLSAGHIWYTDPGYGDQREFINGVEQNIGEIAPDSGEFYAGIALDLPLQPQFTAYYDYRALDYQYYSLSFSHTLKPAALGDGFNLTPFVAFGFASNAHDDKNIYNSNGLEHINVGVSSTVNWGIFQLKPSVTYVFGTDDKINGEKRTSNALIVGVDVGYDLSL